MGGLQPVVTTVPLALPVHRFTASKQSMHGPCFYRDAYVGARRGVLKMTTTAYSPSGEDGAAGHTREPELAIVGESRSWGQQGRDWTRRRTEEGEKNILHLQRTDALQYQSN